MRRGRAYGNGGDGRGNGVGRDLGVGVGLVASGCRRLWGFLTEIFWATGCARICVIPLLSKRS